VSIDIIIIIIIIIIGTSSPLLGQKITHNISNHLITLQTFNKIGVEEKKLNMKIHQDFRLGI